MRAENKFHWFFLGVLIFLALFFLGGESEAFSIPQTNTRSLNLQELEKEKLRQEIVKLQLENQGLKSTWNIISAGVPLITALLAVVGLFVTIWKQINQRNLDRQQREDESMRRLDERFASIVKDLCSENRAIQASAAVSILTFLKNEYKVFHDQVFMILLANLKVQHHDSIQKLLVKGFEKALQLQLEYDTGNKKNKEIDLDLSRAQLNHIDLSKVNLIGIDVAFSELRNSNFTESNLKRARGIKANLKGARLSRAILNEARFRQAGFCNAQFHESNLVSADFRETDLRNAQFQGAEMQSAHFDKAQLQGAKFENANISDAYFVGAVLDKQTIKSIFHTKNWENAHFDEGVRAALEAMKKEGKNK
jgi:uncharacterized protein YjbI with pentapeptide repeats